MSTTATGKRLAGVCARIQHAEFQARRRTAQDFANYFSLALLQAQEQRPSLTAAELTIGRLQQTENGKIIRRAANTLAQLKGIPEARARRLLRISVNLHHHGRAILEKLASGDVSVEVAVEAAQQLDSIAEPRPKKDAAGKPWTVQAYEAERDKVERAKRRLGAELGQAATPDVSDAEFGAAAKKLRHRHHPTDERKRHAAAQGKRHVRVHEGADGMSTLTGFIPTTTAQQVMRRLNQLAASHRHRRADQRTRTQLEADLFAEVLLSEHTTPEAAARPPKVSVLLLLTLADAIGLGACIAEDQLPYLRRKYPQLHAQAERNRKHFTQDRQQRRTAHPSGAVNASVKATELLSGHELSPQLASEYFHRANYLRAVITDPISGYPIGTGSSYRPTRELKELVHLRDRHCRHPGCTAPLAECELNHTDPWAQGGATSYANLEAQCRKHHTGLSARWWTVRAVPQEADGVREFTDEATAQRQRTHPKLPLDEDAWADYRRRLTKLDEPPF